MQGHADLCDLLVERNASIDYTARDGSTPLHLAVQEDREVVAQLLLNYGTVDYFTRPFTSNSVTGSRTWCTGANPNLRNGRGRRPVDLASSERLRLGLKAGAKPTYGSCALFGELDQALVGYMASFFIVVSSPYLPCKHSLCLIHLPSFTAALSNRCCCESLGLQCRTEVRGQTKLQGRRERR